MGVVRLFVAVAVPEDVKEKVAAFQDSLKSAGAQVNWTRPNGIHITMKFLGETEEERIPDIGVAMGHAVNGFSPFQVEGKGTGFFPDARKPRVSWVGLEGDVKKLVHLHRRVEAEFEAIGFPSERREFAPHLTVGRIRSDRNLDGLAAAAEKAKDREFGTIPVDRLILFRSELLPSGAEYTAVLEEPFRY